MDFGRLVGELRMFQSRRRRNPPEDQHFAQYLLRSGYDINSISEPELRGIAEMVVGSDPVMRESWMEDFVSYLGYPYTEPN